MCSDFLQTGILTGKNLLPFFIKRSVKKPFFKIESVLYEKEIFVIFDGAISVSGCAAMRVVGGGKNKIHDVSQRSDIHE